VIANVIVLMHQSVGVVAVVKSHRVPKLMAAHGGRNVCVADYNCV
jgi:hypothetical protein